MSDAKNAILKIKLETECGFVDRSKRIISLNQWTKIVTILNHDNSVDKDAAPAADWLGSEEFERLLHSYKSATASDFVRTRRALKDGIYKNAGKINKRS